MKETFKTKIVGQVKIMDQDGNVLLEKNNAIHPKNMAIAIARGLSNSPRHQIFKIKFGNGGTYVDNGKIVFKSPITTGDDADIYNATYVEVIDEQNSSNPGNSVVYSVVPNTTNTRVIATAVVSSNEAVNRPADESPGSPLDPEGDYFFDELGLFLEGTGTYDPVKKLKEANESLLTHLIFSPIEHTGNRELTVVYSLLISVS